MNEDYTYSFEDLRKTGVLWAINRYIFHPRGLALALHLDDDGNATGWSIMGNGTEVWAFDEKSDDDAFLRFESFMQKKIRFQLEDRDK